MQDITEHASLNTSPQFKLLVVGRINHDVLGAPHISCADGTQLRVMPTPKDYPDKRRLWHLLPQIDSTAIISNVRVLDSSPLEVEQHDGGECVLVGKVLQVSKRNSVVLFSVEQPLGKAMKITLTNPDERMKAEQIWSVKSFLVDHKLQIVEADPLSPVEELENQVSPQEKASTPKPVIANPSPPNQKAIEAIALSTGIDGWELMTATRRNHGWEWQAINPKLNRKARATIAQGQYQVYEYNPNIALVLTTSPDTERLVVTPLGAARGIGASCFKVEIGPYEVVLDCGTRPKGCDPLPALEYLDKPNLLLVSHAYSDHLGAVPIFHIQFPAARMISTPGTREIAYVMLTDCLKFHQLNEDSEPLFDEVDLERTLFHLETEPIGHDFEPLPGLKVRFINAGHIVGSGRRVSICNMAMVAQRTAFGIARYSTQGTTTLLPAGLQKD